MGEIAVLAVFVVLVIAGFGTWLTIFKPASESAGDGINKVIDDELKKKEIKSSYWSGMGCVVGLFFGVASFVFVVLFLPSVGTLMVFQDNPEINPSGQLIESTEYYGVSPTWEGYYTVEVTDDLFNLDARVWKDWVASNTSGDYGKLEDHREYKPVSHYLYVPGKCYATKGSVDHYPAQYNKLYPIPDQPGMSCWRAPYLSVPYKHYKGDPYIIRVIKISPFGREVIFEKIGKDITVRK